MVSRTATGCSFRKVLISGLRGLGVETAKNLILAGPKVVVLHDDGIVETRDLGANFYLTEEHVVKVSRADACAARLMELNPYVNVSVKKGPLDDAGMLIMARARELRRISTRRTSQG